MIRAFTSCAFLQRASAAFLAIAFRFRSDREAARARPPLDAPSLDSATAAGFLVSGTSGRFGNGLPSIVSPIRFSMTDRASRLGSRGCLGVLAREGMVRLWHMKDANGRLVRYYVVSVNSTLAIWQLSDAQIAERLKQKPGSAIIGMPHSTRAEAENGAKGRKKFELIHYRGWQSLSCWNGQRTG